MKLKLKMKKMKEMKMGICRGVSGASRRWYSPSCSGELVAWLLSAKVRPT